MAPVIITSVLDFKVNGYIILNFPITFNVGLPNQRATNGTLPFPWARQEKDRPILHRAVPLWFYLLLIIPTRQIRTYDNLYAMLFSASFNF